MQEKGDKVRRDGNSKKSTRYLKNRKQNKKRETL
jgi:hypothetical protein